MTEREAWWGRPGWRQGVLAAAVVCLLATAARAGEAPLNLWPVFDDRVDPVAEERVTRALGPLVEYREGVDQPVESVALRPLFHWQRDRRHDQDASETEILYPLFTYRRADRDVEFQFLQLLNGRAEGQPGERERRFDLFPFYFSGRTEDGDRYWALLPFGGRVRDRLGQDEIWTVLFPLYARFRRGEALTTYAPWPLVSRTTGPGRSGFRVAPLYGRDRQDGVFEREFVLWPLYLHQRVGLDTDNPEETHALLPFYVAQRAPQRDSTTVLWPFFTHTEDRERGYEQWDAPWPLVQVARGEKQVTRVLPFFSVEARVLRQEFLLRELKSRQLIVLFPLYLRTEDEVPGTLTVRDRVLWWLYSDERQTGKDGARRRVDAWPFFLYVRDLEGHVRFQALALLEAMLPGNEWVERNYSPLWSLYTMRRSPQGAEVHSFLWNLLRHEETPATRSIEVLGPLLRYHEAAGEAQLSLFGGLVRYAVAGARHALQLWGAGTLRWDGAPQPIAALATEGALR